MRHGSWVLVLLAGFEMGCMSGRGVASGSALVHSQFPYSVTYEDEKAKSVLGDEWLLENYRRASVPGTSGASANGNVEIERKEGYEHEYELDFDDDDEPDTTVKLPGPDLLLINRKTNARIEVTTLLLDKRLAQKELRVLLNNVVESDAGTRSLVVGFGKAAVGVERRMASRLLDSGAATLDQQSGLVATVERANVDQLALDPKARWSRSRILLLRAPFDYYGVEAQAGQTSKRYHKYGVLMMVEYTNSTEDFEAQYPDLLRLLNKIHLLSDDMLLDYLAEPLSHCSKGGSNARVKLSVSELGAPAVTEVEGLTMICARRAVDPFRFRATSEARTLERSYDFSKPLKPAWLTQGTYVEERPPAAATPPAEAPPAPAPPAGDAPAEAPPPAGDVAPPPSTGAAEAAPEAAPKAPAP